MSWRAETEQREFGPGTLLTVYWQPWGLNVPQRFLTAGESVLLCFTAGGMTPLTVVQMVPTEAIMQTSDGAKWKIVEATLQQRVMAARAPDGALASYWLVKERV